VCVRLDFLRGFAKRECLGLSKYIGQKYVVMPADRFSGCVNATKSQGISLVPWWIN